MPGSSPHTLILVDDRHHEPELRRTLAEHRDGGATTVLTGDALLAMCLRAEGHDVRLTLDDISGPRLAELDRLALGAMDAALDAVARAPDAAATGNDLARYARYTLIPSFIRAVRNVFAVGAAIDAAAIDRIRIVGGGPLANAARLVAADRGVRVEAVRAAGWSRLAHLIARLRDGRATKWVNTEFRALVLEPGFIVLLFLKGWCRRLVSRPPALRPPHAIIVSGDRWTFDVIDRLRRAARPIVLAGATQPGRSLFATLPGLVPIEAFSDPLDLIRGGRIAFRGWMRRGEMPQLPGNPPAFVVGGTSIWPLVARAVQRHVTVWVPLLRHLRQLTSRAAKLCPEASLLVSGDAPAYNGVLIGTARACGIPTIGIQHGVTGEPNGHEVARIDVLAAWGHTTEPWYRLHAAQHAAFVVTGNPRFDPLSSRPPAPRRENAGAFVIVVCTGFVSEFSVGASEYENLLMLDCVLKWATAHPGAKVIHKMHPGEELEYYADAARKLGWDQKTLTTIREPILYEVLERADVLVAAYSTTVLESVVLGTPAIVVDAIVQRRLLPLDRIPGIAIVYSIDELYAQLEARRAAPAPDRPALRASAELREYISELDGQATERVAALLELR